MKRFDGLTVLITGATGGFGSTSAKMFAEEGANLVLSDHPSQPLEDFAKEFSTPVKTLAGDVSDPALHEELVKLAQSEFGHLDVAVNNAGISHGLSLIHI